MKIVLMFISCIAAALAAEINLKEFASNNRKFSAVVYDEILVDNNENILVSPFSVETVLALTQAGAVGETGEEIRTSLFLPKTKEETEKLVQTVLPRLKSDDYVLHTANKIYVEKNFEINKDFKKAAKNVYGAGIENVEFSKTVKTAEKINKWVEKETENKIHDLIDPDDLDESTELVLINALYFQGNWTAPFEPLKTRKSVFYASDSEIVFAEMMSQQAHLYNFYESEELDAKFLELPFVGQDASMTIILPNKKEGIAILEKQMRSVLIAPKYNKNFVKVSLPKFRIESSIDFKEILEKLGVRAAFDSNKADFSGIGGSPGEISISKVIQKTFIDVSEGGVEAAAATAEIAEGTSFPLGEPKTFIADHPFAFFIKVNGIVLFEGRVLEPNY